MNWSGIYFILLGLLCLFFPGLIIFGYGLNYFMDYFVTGFLILCCLILIMLGIDFTKTSQSVQKTQEKLE